MIDKENKQKKRDGQGRIYTREMARARYEKKSAEKKEKPRREIEDPVEAKILKAMADGEFDNLKGKGKPLDLNRYEQVAEHMRLAYHILRNADFVPEEVRLKREMEELKEKIGQCRSESDKKALRKELADVSQQFHFTMEYNKQFNR